MAAELFRMCGDDIAFTHRFMRQRIDYVFADPGWTTASYQVIRSGPSDHWPVLVELRREIHDEAALAGRRPWPKAGRERSPRAPEAASRALEYVQAACRLPLLPLIVLFLLLWSTASKSTRRTCGCPLDNFEQALPSIANLAGSPVLPGNAVQMLQNGDFLPCLPRRHRPARAEHPPRDLRLVERRDLRPHRAWPWPTRPGTGWRSASPSTPWAPTGPTASCST